MSNSIQMILVGRAIWKCPLSNLAARLHQMLHLGKSIFLGTGLARILNFRKGQRTKQRNRILVDLISKIWDSKN